MNFKLLLLIAIVGISAISYGLLANELTLDIQRFEQVVLPPLDENPIPGTTEFSSIQCSCRDPNDPNGQFDPSFCDQNTIGETAAALCTWPIP
jgi:hypothetical protein